MRRLGGEGGFTMVEMITTMTILAILSVFSVKPMGKYIAKARQAEAKTTLGHISTLQSVHAIDKQTYANAGTSGTYGGVPAHCEKGGSNINKTKSACTGSGETWKVAAKDCNPGDLDLKLQGCNEMRYLYAIKGDTNGFFAIAQVKGDDIIFGCKPAGSPAPSAIAPYSNTKPGEGTRYGGTIGSIPATQEDVHFVTEEQGLTTAFDVTANCD